MSFSSVNEARRALGAEFVHELWVTLRSGQLYESTNETLTSAAERLRHSIRSLQEIDRLARFETGGDIIEINGTRIRSELRSYAVHSKLKRFIDDRDIGGFQWSRAPRSQELAEFATVVSRYAGNGEASHRELADELARAGLESPVVLPRPGRRVRDTLDDGSARASAAGTYRIGVAVVRDLLETQRAGQASKPTNVRRAVQTIVDQVLTQETLILGLTCLEDYDEPTFTHCVNVCILSVSLGHKIGLSRLELYRLGMAALLHDIGKVDVRKEVLNKAGALTDDEWAEMRRHTTYGAWRLLADWDEGAIPDTELLAAFEHHLNLDLSGYPKLYAPRELAFYSKIIAIADAFDAGTTPRVYKTDPITPAEMVEILERHKQKRFDPVLLKAFISVLGIFPSGSLCLLDTGEVGIVVEPDPDPLNLRRPRMKLIADSEGRAVEPVEVSLAEVSEEGTYARSIVRVLEPERYGIDIQRFVTVGIVS